MSHSASAPTPAASNVAGELFGRPILDAAGSSYTEQIYGILIDLIHQGYWKVGERLPSISELSDKCHFSRRPIGVAFNQLAEEGYIRQEGRRGSFLISQFSKNRELRRTIGLVMTHPLANETSSAQNILLHNMVRVFRAAAARRNYQTETMLMDWNADFSNINTPAGPFSERVCGIFMLTAGNETSPSGLNLAGHRIPVLYINTSDEGKRMPSLNNDTWSGMYRLTQQVIAAGHRRIAVFCDPPSVIALPEVLLKFHAEKLEANILTPHRLAMREAGLEVDEEAIAFSSALPYSNLAFVRDFLERFSDATCIIALRHSPMQVVEMAELLGRRVPEDLSVVAGHTGPFPMRANEPESLITGMCMNPDIADLGFDFLNELEQTGGCRILRAKISPLFVEGASLAAPRVKSEAREFAGAV